MNKTMFNAILFTAGAAIGSLVTWKIVETKYSRIAQEEIDSVKDEYGRLRNLMKKEIDACRRVTAANQNDSDEDDEEDTDEKDDEYCTDDERDFTDEREAIEYYKLSDKYRASNDEDDENIKEGDKGIEEEAPYINGPYVISPDDFGSIPGYSSQPLDYFSDGILADGWGVELDLDETIGEDAIEHFGEYVDDVVYVRNESTEIDYEVTRDPRTYNEAVRTNPDPYYGHAN